MLTATAPEPDGRRHFFQAQPTVFEPFSSFDEISFGQRSALEAVSGLEGSSDRPGSPRPDTQRTFRLIPTGATPRGAADAVSSPFASAGRSQPASRVEPGPRPEETHFGRQRCSGAAVPKRAWQSFAPAYRWWTEVFISEWRGLHSHTHLENELPNAGTPLGCVMPSGLTKS